MAANWQGRFSLQSHVTVPSLPHRFAAILLSAARFHDILFNSAFSFRVDVVDVEADARDGVAVAIRVRRHAVFCLVSLPVKTVRRRSGGTLFSLV